MLQFSQETVDKQHATSLHLTLELLPKQNVKNLLKNNILKLKTAKINLQINYFTNSDLTVKK